MRTPIASNDPVAFACRIKREFPAIPSREALAIAVFVSRRGRGRTSSTKRGQTLAVTAITRAVESHVRHGHTPYDAMLREHGDKKRARADIQSDVDAVMRAWRDIRVTAPRACRRCWQATRHHLAEIVVRAA